MNTSKYTTKDIERFWTKVNIPDDPDACWEWQASGERYGLIAIRRKLVRVHRMSYEIHYGEIHDNLCVLHHCDNTKCVRPDHLFLGTQAENLRDMRNKNRQYNVISDKGEDHHSHKLTWAQVREIRRRYKKRSRDNNIYVLAKEFNVDFTTIGKIVKNKTWKE